MIGRCEFRIIVLSAAMLCTAGFLPTRAESAGSTYLVLQQWLQTADVMAHESVTYEICGWGFIDLRTPLLSTAIGQGLDVTFWDALTERYDRAQRERRMTEAILTAYGKNAPAHRFGGLYATGGCTDAVKARIEHLPKGMTPPSPTAP